ncbi:MAG: CotH kinase family protein [Acidimicrobiia bacterium]|nr:CotH kinase family protein [Acidimicrobiia bacterium]
MNSTWRRHWKIPAGLLLLVVGLIVGAGQIRVIAYVGTGGDDTVGSSAGGTDYANTVDLFDEGVVHAIELDFDQADLDTAIAIYQETGEKEYFPANITIDGVTIEEVGVRMKGNSTLRAALQSGGVADEIPYLVKLDEYTSGVAYQGFAELALRTEGPRGDDLILEEMATAAVLDIAGLPFPETSYSGLSINGSSETLRVVVELLDNGYVERLFDDDGVLYKAQSGDSFTYLGHDPLAYDGAFTQESAVNSADLEPLIDLLEFVDTASDDEFETELEDWLDIDSFISYIAVNNLLVSVDSMPGNGNNYYLWYDDADEQFTVLAWDLNESFGGFWASRELSTALLPDWSNVTGSQDLGDASADLPVAPGAGGPVDDVPADLPVAPGGGGPGGDVPSDLPVAPGAGGREGGIGGERPADGVGAGGREGVAGGERPAGEIGVGGGDFGFDFDSPLVDRFLATNSFRAAYEERYAELFEILLMDGAVVDLIDRYSALLSDANDDRDLVADRELATAVNSKLQWVAERIAFLAPEQGVR